MADYLIAPPDEKVIPVTRGADRAFTIRRVDANGAPVSFGTATVYMYVDVDPASPTVINATVTTSQAAFVLPSTVLDLVKNRARWRIVWDQGDLETPLLVGRFERHDG